MLSRVPLNLQKVYVASDMAQYLKKWHSIWILFDLSNHMHAHMFSTQYLISLGNLALIMNSYIYI